MWNDTDIPQAYLITFRCYGTWLHGDGRGSVDRFNNQHKTPLIPQNKNWHQHNRQTLKADPVLLNAEQRHAVEFAIRETSIDETGFCEQPTSEQIMSMRWFQSVWQNLKQRSTLSKQMQLDKCAKMVVGNIFSVLGLIKEANDIYGVKTILSLQLIT